MTTDVADTLVGALHTGLLGGGSMARVPSHAARANGADPTALATSRLESAEGAATSLGVSRADADAVALLSDGDSDVVHICTRMPPTRRSRRQPSRRARTSCARSRWPPASTMRGVSWRPRRRRIWWPAVPFVYRYHPMAREAHDRIARGSLRMLLSLDASYLPDWMLRPGDDDWPADADTGALHALLLISARTCATSPSSSPASPDGSNASCL